MKANKLYLPKTGFKSPLISYWTLAILMLACMVYSLLNADYYFRFVDTETYFKAWNSLRNFRPDILRTPLYPLVITPFALLFGKEGTCFGIYLFQWIVFFISVLYFRKTATMLMGDSPRFVFLATACYGLWQYIWGYNVCILTESLSISFTVFFVRATIKNFRVPSVNGFWIVAGWILILMLLRPAFSYLIVVYTVGLILLTFSRKRKLIVKPLIVGYLSLLCIIGFQIAYIKAMEVNYGIHSVSSVSIGNNLYSLREINAIRSEYTDNEELKNIIDSCFMDAPSGRGLELRDEFNPLWSVPMAEVEDFERKAIADNVKAIIWNTYYYRYVLDMSHRELENHYGTVPLAISILPPMIFIHNVFILCILYAIYVLWSMIRAHKIEICPVILWLTVMGLGAVTLIGAMAEFSRLIAPVIPIFVLMMAQMLSRIRIIQLV